MRKVSTMAQTSLRTEQLYVQRPEYSSWLQELRANTRKAEQEELEELESIAVERAQ